MGRRVRLGLAGLGRMGRLHAENLVRSPSIELVRVVDTVEEAARATGEQLEVEWSTSYEDLLQDPEIEGVVLVTPTALHAQMIGQAVGVGKHVFCEKPIALELEPTARAIEAAATAGVKLQVGFHRRFDPDWAAAAARIRAGELGDVHLFRSSLRDKRPPSIDYIAGSGGFFADVTIHDAHRPPPSGAQPMAHPGRGFRRLGGRLHATVPPGLPPRARGVRRGDT